MKAVRYHAYGDSGVLVYEDADRPAAGAGRDAGQIRRCGMRWGIGAIGAAGLEEAAVWG